MRRVHDIAAAILAMEANGIGAVASVLALLIIPRWSYRPLEG